MRATAARAGAGMTAFRLANDRMAVEVLDHGATLTGVFLPDGAGGTVNTVLRLDDPADYRDRAKNPYVGSTVGRYCRCVAGAAFTLDGVDHRLDANAGAHHIHGGSVGFDQRRWTGETSTTDTTASARLRLVSPAGDQGYPGELSATATYTLTDDDSLVITYEATSTEPTPVGLTNHAFWNLAGTGTIDDHTLALATDLRLDADEDFIPVPGPPVPAPGARETTGLSGRVIDGFFVMEPGSWAARLAHPATGRQMVMSTDAPGMGVYTGDFHPRPRAGICLEAGAFPDAPNRPDFPAALVRPGELYRESTTHRFSGFGR
ncbi:aldose epimerase family protein [Actinokineospora sp. G85]|uniref:aldose epimerase family protein n=1 Tax=Actinokineospora sp. G85 TaxID=3406626 RepID=UPI003C75E08B